MKMNRKWLKRAAMLCVIVASALAGFCSNAATQLTLNDGDTLTGVYEDYEITIAAGATVTFNGATITHTSTTAPAVNCLGDATIILAPGSVNAVTNTVGGYSCVRPTENATLTIRGSGTLMAAGGDNAAAIGSGNGGTCGSIVIGGGTIEALGGTTGAGIGSGNSGTCGSIVIEGGTVTAQGGDWSAGIGSAYYGTCRNITITGGTVTANVDTTTSDNETGTAAIGAGCRGECGNILISGGTVVADAHSGYSRDDACAIGATYVNGKCGDITLTTGITSLTATKGRTAQQHIGQGDGSATVGRIYGMLRFDKEYSNDGNTVTLTPKASFESYTVTWKNDDGATADTTTVEYGLMPEHADATKSSDVDFDYVFAGWTPELAEVESNTTYTAVFSSVPRVRSTGGNAEWFFEADGSLRSGAIGDRENTWFRASLPRPCIFTFEWKTSSEGNCDKLGFTVNGEDAYDTAGNKIEPISGVKDNWATVSLVVSNSLDVLEWKYWKDNSSKGGQDCGWIRNFSMAPYEGEVRTLSVVPNYDGEATVNAYASKDCVLGVFPVVARYGYAFLGLFTAAEGGELVEPPYALSANTTLYAHWAKTSDFDTSAPTAEWTIEDDGITWCTGAIGHNANTWATYTVKRPCTVTYKWKTSTEANNDPLVFYVDDVEQSRISGEMTDWADISLTFEDSANHVLKWVYSKDGSATGRYDCGWIRDFVVTPLDSWAVTRDLNYEGAGEIETRYVKKGNQLDVSEFPPLDEPREGYTCYWALAPWSGDALTNAVDISADTTFYAHWIKQHGFDEIDTTCQTPWTWLDDGSIRTGKIGDSGNTWVTISVTGPCDVSFKWKSSSENGWDKLHFYVDADHKTDISGVQDDWTTYSVSVGSGDHVLKWSYTKDGNKAIGEDCGWVKDIVITAPDSAPYTVTWKNADGTVLETDADLAAGAVSAYNSALPTRAADAQYTYEFAGWTPEFELVSSNTAYTAVYTATLRSYDVTWQNEDGTQLGTTNIFYGATPVYDGETPTKASTAQYHYEFAGWNPAVAEVTGEATYTATYNSILRSYTITWKNDDGSTIDTTTVNYGVVPTHAAPTKASTAQYDYTFAGWGEVVAVTGEATYQATFTPVLRSYTITWKNDDGSTIDTTTVNYGVVPTHAAPTKASTAQYDYTFAGWGEVVAVTGEATYQATFTPVLRSYTITWLNDDNSLIGTTTVAYGTTPTHAAPTKAETAEYTYTFSGWTPSVASVTGAATYTATFNATKRSYTITWLNEGGAVLASGDVEYGTVPAYGGATPTKAETAEYTYTFAGWDKTVVAVTGAATYTATFNATKRSYTITWLNEGGAVLASGDVEYGTVPAYGGATPTKAETAEYTYTFAGWDKAVVAVTGAATYTATFNATKRNYTITWANIDGAGASATSTVEYGTVPAYGGATPTKAETAEYTYTFAGWDKAVVAVTGAATYTATFDATPKEPEDEFAGYIKIGDVAGFEAIANNLATNYVLMADIDLQNVERQPFGEFSGILDGNGHVIRNLNIKRNDSKCALFSYLNGATIRNLTLQDGKIEIEGNNSDAAGIAGHVQNGALIEDCTVDGLEIISKNLTAGGFVGYAESGNLIIRRCRSLALITANGSDSAVGGFVGYTDANVQIEDCYYSGVITAGRYTGGIVGQKYYGTIAISNCYHNSCLYPDTNNDRKLVGNGDNQATITGNPTVIDAFHTGGVRVKAYGAGTGTASYDAATGEITATPAAGSFYAGYIGMIPDGEFNDVTVWAVFGKEIATVGEFNAITNNLAGVYKLTADIDLQNVERQPFGEFSGVFDGNGHAVKNITITKGSDTNIGLFSLLNGATIRNLTLDGGRIEGYDNVGGIAGKILGDTLIEDSSVNIVVFGNRYTIGGFVGYADGGNVTFRRCRSFADVTSVSGESGGLVGSTNSDNLRFEDCYAEGMLVARNQAYCGGSTGYSGGLVGLKDNSGSLAISNCYHRATMVDNGFNDRQLVGNGDDKATITGVPSADADLTSGVPFEGWDTTVWKFTEGLYPRLRVFIPQYTVTWHDEDGVTVLDEAQVDEFDTPVYGGVTPTKAETAEYTYTFAGWAPAVAAVESNTTYTATYDATPKTPELPEGVVDLSALTGNYTAQEGDVLTGATGYAITIAAGATVTLDGVTITHTSGSGRAAIDCAGNAIIVLAEDSENFVSNLVDNCAAIHPAVDATLTIRGSGSLDAYSSGRYGAGIGAASATSNSDPYPCGNIVIEGGTITATGGYAAAGVGAAAWSSPCGAITITSNAVVNATGGAWGAGVGAASDSSPCGDITISGNASVTATSTAGSNAHAAGIGAADYSQCGSIVISTTGTVESQGIDAAGIGADRASCSGITITGGTITATGGSEASAIGASIHAGCGDILISGGTITATGGVNCPGVGALGETDSITITGGNVTSIGGSNSSGGNGGAGIGSTYNRTCGYITISGGTVTATGGAWSAGIGSSYYGTCGDITISGGTVTANVCTSTGDNETDTVAIGAGCRGTCGNILILGGTVVADATNPQSTSYDYNSAIGATYVGTCGDITITDGITSVTATKGASAAATHIGKGYSYGTVIVGTVAISPRLAQSLSNNELTLTLTPLDVPETVTVTWKNEDGTTLEMDTVAYGATPTYDGETPTKTEDAQYTYEFAGWIPAVVTATSNTTYTAQFEATKRSYTVSWVVEGVTVASGMVEYGATPSYDGETPTKAATAQYTYTFTGWSPAITTVTGDATYTAQFEATKRSYLVSWVVEGVTVASGAVEYGTTPAYSGETPTKAATAQYTYTFTGWDTAPVAVTGPATYTATFNATVNEYEISWVVEGATVASGAVEYGQTPSYGGETPTKESTAEYSYEFTGWSPAVSAVTGAATYTATFEATKRSYTVTWVVEGVTVASGSVEYGTTPVYNGATPTKPEDENYTYTFNGWTPAVVAVIGNATYTATFTATPKETEDPDEPYNGTETINGITWSYTVADGEATITGVDPSDCDLVIPASVNDGIPVTVIGYEAFWCSDITSVVIPNSVTNICPDAFNDCGYLTNVVIGSGVVTIGGCVGQRTSIYDDPDEYIYTGAATAFGACSSLMGFTLAEGNPVFEEIDGALYYRNAPNSAKTLALYPSGRSTLYFADGLTVTKIGDGACAWCQEFTNLTIPSTVLEIGAASFDFCREMTSVVIPDSVTNICDGAFRNNGELLAVEVPGSVKKIGNGAFYHNISLTTLVLDEGIETIGSRAFEVCWSLNGEIVIPDGVTAIGRSAFSGAYEVDALSLPDTLTFIGADAFGYCESIQRLVVPLSVEEIEIAEPGDDYVSGAFANCSGLTEIYMPSSLKPATEEATQTYLANIFEGVTTNNTDAERLAEILTWYSDYSEIGGGEPEEPTELPDYVTTGGDAEWYVEGNDGVEPGAWRSGAIGHSNSTWIETTVTGPCLVSFQWRVSSEEGYDKLHLTVDGEERDPISGSADWDNVSLTFRDAGSHTIRWTYQKDSSASNGEDCGWVKDFTATPHEFTFYTVTWKNWDGTVLGTNSVLEDDMPEYTAATPTRPKDDEYTYVFNGWSPDIVAATGNVEYTATYTALPNLPASVTTGGDAEWFIDTDGSWRSGTIMNSQETWIETTVTGPCLVTFSWKASSEGGGYDMLALAVDGEEKDSIGGVMSDWVEYSLPIPESGAHTIRWTYSKDDSAWEGEDCGWVKDFTETPKTFTSYTVTWKNWDGTVLGEDSVVEGFMPQYRGETPARATDEDYYYTFAGWTPVVASVTGDTIYTATYNAYQARFEMVMDGTTVTGYIGLLPKHITLADWPVGVTAVADDVFSGYSIGDPWIIESVEIPATVETLGQRAFYNAYGLTNLVFEAGGTQPLEIGLATFAFAYSLESVALPARLASIGGSGFYQCTKLATVTFLGDFDSVEIAQDAFKGTPYYATLPFKMILMEIDGQQKVVSYQGTLPKVITAADWPAEATAVAGGSLGWNSIVKDITIPATITSVDAQAFFRSEELTNVVFAAAAPGEDPVPLAIEESAFGECYKLRSVTFRDGLSRIAGYAFYGCPLLAEINFPPSGTEGAYIADSAFAGTEYESNLPFMFYVDEMNIITGFRGTCPPKLGGADGYPWPEGVECIGSDAFSGCTTLEHVTLPAGITAVALGAFRDCRNLATVNFAPSFETLLSIGGEAFSGCTSLETVELDGDGLYVDRGAFEGCASLTTLTLGAGVSKVDEYAFAYTTRLEAFVNNSSADIDETAFLGSGYYKNMPFSFITKREYGSLVIAGYKGSPTQINAADWPAGVTYVNRRSFTFCTSLRAIEFPAHIEYIDEGAFACCTNLASITFPERSVLYVGHNAFALCTKLQNVTLKSGMDIDEDVFAGCASLETVIVEEGVGTIGAGAFARTLVRSIVLPEGVHWVYNDSFAGNDGDFTLYIPRNADGGNYGVSSGSVAYEYIPRIFGLETEEGWARYGLVVRKTTTNLRVVPYCRVTLDLDGGTGVATSQLGTGETVNDQFPHPVKAGFAFAGWMSERVADVTSSTTWTEITGSETGMDAYLTALWTPNEEPELPEIVIEDEELRDKLDDPIIDEDTGVRTIKPKDEHTVLTQEDADAIIIKSPLAGFPPITGAYIRTCSWQLNEIFIRLRQPDIVPVAVEENKEEEDATGLLEDVAKVEPSKIAAMPTPKPATRSAPEEVGAIKVDMYPGLYYQASWGNDLNNLTSGEKFQANGTQTHIGVIKQTGAQGFYKISVSEK